MNKRCLLNFASILGMTAGLLSATAPAVAMDETVRDAYLIIDLKQNSVRSVVEVPDLLIDDVYRTTQLVLRRISPGRFDMGDLADDKQSDVPGGQFAVNLAIERPVHPVNITRPFYIGVFPVTQRQWHAVMGDWPSEFTDARDMRPVERVSWKDLRDEGGFLATLSQRLNRVFRLPTEAEWEYACRAGTRTRYSYGDLADEAFMAYASNSAETRQVGALPPNPWGLYDMHGNVMEWCEDRGSPDYYQFCLTHGIRDDPPGPVQGAHRVIRGGSWFHDQWWARSSARGGASPARRSSAIGVRIVIEALP
jgi:formylglycine-generating enzyme required for sulfatase activity